MFTGGAATPAALARAFAKNGVQATVQTAVRQAGRQAAELATRAATAARGALHNLGTTTRQILNRAKTALKGEEGFIALPSIGKKGDGLLAPGPHAGQSIPGDATRDFTRTQRDKINDIMAKTGCHRCGTKNPGTKSGDAIPDHQPPLSISPGPYRLYPHCLACSRGQGLVLANRVRAGGL